MISWDFMRFQSCHVCGFCGGIKASEHLRSVWTSKSSNLRISSQDLSGLNLRQRGDTDRSCGRHMRYEVSDSSDQIHWIDHWSVLNESIHHNSAWFSLSKCSRSGLSLGCVFFFGRMTVVLRLSPSGGGTGNLQSGGCCCRTSTWQGGLSAWENDCNMLTYVASCCILRSLKENKKSSESSVADYRPGSQCHANELKTNLEMCHMLHALHQYVTFIQHKRPHKRDDHIIWPS